MAAPAAPTAPAAPATGVRIVDTPPPAPPPAPTSSILVSSMAPPAEPAAPAKTGTAMDRLTSALRSKGKDPNAPPAKTPSPVPKQASPKAATDSPSAAPPEGESGTQTPGSPEAGTEAPAAVTPPEGQTPPTDPKAGKVSPWKLVEQYKTRVSAIEKELADAKAANLPEVQRKEYLGQIETLQSKNKELEDHIRFVDYTKSSDFQTKYQQPYEAAWQRAMSELSEISILGADGAQRPATSDDLLQLVNLPLGKAREIADEVFGAFSNDVMQHRKEIRSLFESQSRALKEARENGATRQKQEAELAAKSREETSGFIKEVWQKAHETIHKDPEHGKWFQPTEGDQDGNQRLAKGFELVDRAFSENPEAPGLTKEQRASIVQRHVAVRNRAAAYGRLVAMVKKLEGEKASLAKELEGYTKSTPESGNVEAAPGGGSPNPSARENIFAELRKRAK